MIAQQNQIPSGEGLTLEKLWAYLNASREESKERSERAMAEWEKKHEQEMAEWAELRRQFAETRALFDQTDRQIEANNKKALEMFDQTDRQIEANNRKTLEMFDRTDRQIEANSRKISAMFDRTDRQIKANNKEMGHLSNRFGELVEHLVAPGIAERFEDLGLSLQVTATRFKVLVDANAIAEVDVLLESGETIVSVSVKAKPNTKGIRELERQLTLLRKWCSNSNDPRRILGAVAGAVFSETEKKTAIKAGFYVITQTGDTMKMEVPEGFVPREW